MANKKILVAVLLLALLLSCSIYNMQSVKFRSGHITGVIWKVEPNNVGGYSVFIDKYTVNVWPEDMKPNYAVDSVATFKVKWLTKQLRPVKK